MCDQLRGADVVVLDDVYRNGSDRSLVAEDGATYRCTSTVALGGSQVSSAAGLCREVASDASPRA